MHVLVTGGAGFIGSHTVETLLEAGLFVRVLDNFSSGKQHYLPAHSNLEILVGDIREARDVARAMDGITHVLHLAAQVSVQASVEDPSTSCAQNILGFVTVLHAAVTHQVRRFVYASSAAVYGTPERVPIAEEDPIQPISPYGLEKYVNEQYAALFRTIYGLSSLGLRYFNVYGPRQDARSPYAGVISKFLDCLRQGEPLTVFGDGAQTRDFIFVKDIARANYAALTSEQVGVCNVATGQSWTLLQLIETLCTCAGEEVTVRYEPARTGDIRHSEAKVERLRSWLAVSRTTSLAEGIHELLHATCSTRA
ncbi:MAG: NAD-dependent epimerase/dehydratase family protein [Nitrospirae bacterium]|nr:MAG: NAD-dependent epimerase/dehydratase family protein [Nitrospirota bacterium]